jgi:hypothetical protein
MRVDVAALVCDSEPAFAVPSMRRFFSASACNLCRKNADCATAHMIWNERSWMDTHFGKNYALAMLIQEDLSDYCKVLRCHSDTCQCASANVARDGWDRRTSTNAVSSWQVVVYSVYICIHVVAVNKPCSILCITVVCRLKSNVCRTHNPLSSVFGRAGIPGTTFCRRGGALDLSRLRPHRVHNDFGLLFTELSTIAGG